jgi:hypothetical protein
MLVDGLSGTGDQVTAAIRGASRSTGATFDYLLNTAMRESSLDPKAQAKTSSARGLYQFIESTWLTMVKEEGAKYGLGRLASAIERGPDGEYRVSDPKLRAQILKLREDPKISSLMAGALATRNADELTSTLGRKPTSGELYLAHFLGAGGAKRLIALQKSNPNASAATAFPDAARANKSIFVDTHGKPKSVSAVLAALTSAHDKPLQRALPLKSSTTVAELRPSLPAQPAFPSGKKNGPAPREAYAHPVSPGLTAFGPEDGNPFKSLFRDGPRVAEAKATSPLSSTVRELWGRGDRDSKPLTIVNRSPTKGAVGEPMDLLGHLRPGGGRSVRGT